MSENESGRNPLDVAAGMADEIFGEWKNYSRDWDSLLAAMQKAAEDSKRRYQMAQRLQAAFAAGAVLASEPRKPRAKRRVMMRDNGKGSFVCPKCDAASDISPVFTAAGRKHGIPCPTCNRPATEISE